MKNIFFILFLSFSFTSFAQTPKTISQLPAYSGSMTGLKFPTDISASQTRYITYETLTGGLVKYVDISSGLTNNSGTITNNLITGLSGGQTIKGGTAIGEGLTFTSTNHSTKGKIYFGSAQTSYFNEASNTLQLSDATSSNASLTINRTSSGSTEMISLTDAATSGKMSWENLASSGFAPAWIFYPKSWSHGTLMTKVTTQDNTNAAITVDGRLTNNGALTTQDVFGVATAGTQLLRIGPLGQIKPAATNTAAGTTGAQTINKPAGTVNFAAGTSSLVVTNSLVSTSSIVYCVVRTADATALIKNVVPGSGSFTINLNANATAETSVGFLVIN